MMRQPLQLVESADRDMRRRQRAVIMDPENRRLRIKKQREMDRLMGRHRSIKDLGLNLRANAILSAANIDTIGELVAKSSGELLKLRQMGEFTLNTVKERLAKFGLSIREGVEENDDLNEATGIRGLTPLLQARQQLVSMQGYLTDVGDKKKLSAVNKALMCVSRAIRVLRLGG